MSAEDKIQQKKTFSFDWLIGGVLTKLGDTFDSLTGRKWNPSSSLATSKLVEKLKFLIDAEVRDLGREGKFVPHIIKLKVQWNKFSTESEEDLDKLEYELHAAMIDHINDKLYHTYAPIDIEIKTDYFTEGVRMLSSFGKFADKENDEVAVNVTIPNLRTDDLIKDNKITVNLSEPEIIVQDKIYLAKFSIGDKPKEVELNFTKQNRISVGRSGGNDLTLNDNSVSKIHASLVFNSENQILVADTGSTNGTFINGNRIAYGKAFPVEETDILKFGTIEVLLEKQFEEIEPEVFDENVNSDETEVYSSDEQIQPTIAAANLDEISQKQENLNDINESEIDSIVSEIKPQAEPTVAFESTEIEEEIPAEPQIENERTDENTEEENAENIRTSNGENLSVNLDKTQDWEI